MAVHKSKSVWLSALGLLTALLWTAQFAVDWYVPHSDIGTAQLDKIELAHVIHTESSDIRRAVRLESKPDPVASTAGPFAADAIRNARNLATFATAPTHLEFVVVLPGIRAPPHYSLSA
jgi:hypothetical protein